MDSPAQYEDDERRSEGSAMKALKIAGIVVGALVLLAMLAVVAVTALFDPNDYKRS